jgi:hypothetical protein
MICKVRIVPHILGIVAIVVAAASMAPAQATRPSRAEIVRQAVLKQREPRPDLAAYTSPALQKALADPQNLLSFIASAQTSYIDRSAAALQGRLLVPIEVYPRILSMRTQLAAEQALHHWGLRLHPLDSRPAIEDVGPQHVPRARTVLDQAWTLPEQLSDYPLTFEEEAAAPWPWQVEESLRNLAGWMRPQSHESGPPDEQDRWLLMCLTLSRDTEDNAWDFVETSEAAGWTHVSSAVGKRVLAQWRAIAIDRKMGRGAVAVSNGIPTVARAWLDPEAMKICEVIATELIRADPTSSAAMNMAYHLKDLRASRNPQPSDAATTLLAACEAAIDPNAGGAWNRLAAYAYSVCEAVPNSPFAPKPGFDGPRPDSPEAAELSAKFAEWFKTNRERLTREAEAREQELRPVRQSLVEAATTQVTVLP